MDFCKIFFLFLSIISYSFANYKDAQIVVSSIEKVTVYSDRVQITRVGQVNNKSKWIHFASLPSIIDKGSIRLKVLTKSVQLGQLLMQEVFESVSLSAEITKKIKLLKKMYGEKLELLQSGKLLKEELTFIQDLKFSAPFTKSSDLYQSFLAPVGQIGSAMDTVKKQSQKRRQKIDQINRKLWELNDLINQLRQELRGVTTVRDQRWTTHVYAYLDSGSAKKVKVELTYVLPNAFWHPLYDVRAQLDHKKGTARINLVTAGLIEQHTGENWKNIEITLSSLDPLPLYLPRLTRWSLAEQREEVPPMEMFRAEKSLDFAPSKVAPKRKRRSFKKEAKMKMKMKMEMAKAKASLSLGVGRSDLFPLQPLDQIFNEYSVIKSDITKHSKVKEQTKMFRPKTLMQRPVKKHYSDSSLPAVQAHGRVLEMVSPFKIDLDHDGPSLKIPFRVESLMGKLRYLVIPKKDKRAFLRAHTTNTTKFPILAGKAQIFMDGALVSKTRLSTIPENNFFVVDLGVDKNIEVNRVVSKKSVEKGVMFKEHSTQVEVKIEIVNHHEFPIEIQIKDNYPLSPNDKIKVELGAIVPKASYDKKGLIYWSATIPGKKKDTFIFTYRVTHPQDYVISEFN